MIVVGAELRKPAERRLRGSERHEDLAHGRGVERDPASRPVAGAQRVARVDLGQPGDSGRGGYGHVRGLAGGPSEPLEIGPGERREVAHGAVTARVLDEHGTRPEAAALSTLREPVSLERAQEARRGGLR